ncbi:MAG: twin-arginine translocase TatA/TatE family subunit [Ilumatobacteraceae bacterium]
MIAVGIGPQELIIVLVIVLIVFGGSSLPKLAKNLGKAQKEFKEGLAEGGKSGESKPSEPSSTDSSQS